MARGHDANGNVADDGTRLFRYDYANRLTEAKLKSTNATIATYRFDALGRRVEKAVVGGTTTRFVYDGQEVVEEYDGNDVWRARYTYEDGIDAPRTMDRADVADVDGDGDATEVLRFTYHQNALGSVTELTSPGGAVVEWTTYDVYGRATLHDRQGTVVAQSAVGNRFLFTGREWDGEIDLYHYRARSYDPMTGRFSQRDSIGYTDSLSLYQYCADAPADYTDPSGHKTWDPKVQELLKATEDFIEARDENPTDSELKKLNDAAAAAWKAYFEALDRWLNACWRHRRGADGQKRALTGDELRDEATLEAALDAAIAAVDKAEDGRKEAQDRRDAFDAAKKKLKAAKDALKKGGAAARQSLLDMIKDSLSRAGPEWQRDQWPDERYGPSPIKDSEMDLARRNPYGETTPEGYMRIADEKTIDAGIDFWELDGDRDIAWVMLHELRHHLLDRSGKDLWEGRPDKPQSGSKHYGDLMDHPPDPAHGAPEAGTPQWERSDRNSLRSWHAR